MCIKACSVFPCYSLYIYSMVMLVWVRTRPVVVHVANSSNANVMVFVSVFSRSPRGVRVSMCIRVYV